MARSVVLALLAARASALCVLRDATVCWGNEHQYVERANFFDGIDVQLAPALADLDGDGDLDLVLGEEWGTLFYYENVGSAASPSYEAVTGAANPFDGIDVGAWSKPAFADVDGDGDLDLVVGDYDGDLYYYERRGGVAGHEAVTGARAFDGIDNVGSAASPSYEAVTGSANPFDGIDVGFDSAPALADLDDDGDLDLVVGEQYGSLFYYENVGSAASPSYAAVTGAANPFDGIDAYSSSSPALADLDSDGDLDLVVGEPDSGGVLNYFEIVGSATSPDYAPVTGAVSPFDGIDVGWSKPALADLDGDGDLDLVVGEQYGSLFYYENVGSAASPAEAVTGAANPFDGIDVGWVSTPALVDLDGDGDLDLVVGENYGVLFYYANVGNATAPSYEAVPGTASPFDGIGVGYNSAPSPRRRRRPRPRRGADGSLYYYENVGSAASPSYAAVTGAANPFDGIYVFQWSAPALADLDDDGDLDLVVGENYGVLFYYENVGSAASPSYEAVTGAANPFDGINVGSNNAPALVDLDGDGDLDLVVGEEDGVLNFFANGYCTQGGNACRGSGLCDLTNVIFSEASCQCLGGFDHEVPDVVMQCGECQAGFYGSTCEPCPQGGDEDRNAPRLTDTCGVAGSGRSRGSCDDAGTVETATFDGYYNIANCTSCDAGTFSAEGDPQVTVRRGNPGAGTAVRQLLRGVVFCSGRERVLNLHSQDVPGRDRPVELRSRTGSFVRADGVGADRVRCGHSGSGADECVDCEAGTYQGETGQSSCALADAGSPSAERSAL
ncbi:hypothetical protein JL721_989 [Aureococcus anophagefferens]|nr:hypothetical protein JL721_989 [Aureococcus anophagefferens]